MEVIRFGTYNIQNFRNGGLELALHGMAQANVNLGLLQENNITDGVYVQDSAGFPVVALDAKSRHHRGV